MAWIESHQSLKEHPKLYKLAALLRVSRTEAIGYLHCLWWWAMDAVKDGDIAGISDSGLKEVCICRRNGNELRSALVESGFVDENQTIHDWEDYMGKLQHKRASAKGRVQKLREQRRNRNANVTRNIREQYADVTPLQTVPTDQPTKDDNVTPTPMASKSQTDQRQQQPTSIPPIPTKDFRPVRNAPPRMNLKVDDTVSVIAEQLRDILPNQWVDRVVGVDKRKGIALDLDGPSILACIELLGNERDDVLANLCGNGAGFCGSPAQLRTKLQMHLDRKERNSGGPRKKRSKPPLAEFE